MTVASAADDIRRAIVAAGGAIPFAEFHRLALYGPSGFYTRAGGGRAGRRGGAFLTSPEVGPLFGAVVARYLDDQWDVLDRFRSGMVGSGIRVLSGREDGRPTGGQAQHQAKQS